MAMLDDVALRAACDTCFVDALNFSPPAYLVLYYSVYLIIMHLFNQTYNTYSSIPYHTMPNRTSPFQTIP